MGIGKNTFCRLSFTWAELIVWVELTEKRLHRGTGARSVRYPAWHDWLSSSPVHCWFYSYNGDDRTQMITYTKGMVKKRVGCCDYQLVSACSLFILICIKMCLVSLYVCMYVQITDKILISPLVMWILEHNAHNTHTCVYYAYIISHPTSWSRDPKLRK